MCVSCEYVGTSRTMPSAPPRGLTATFLSDGSRDAIAPTERTTGDCVVPLSRYSVTFSCQRSSHLPVAAWKVSTATEPSASPWLGTDVRWMSPAAVSSPLFQRPMTYHLVVTPVSVT